MTTERRPPSRRPLKAAVAAIAACACAAGCTTTPPPDQRPPALTPRPSATATPAATTPAGTSPAAAYIAEQVRELDQYLYVFRDFGDGVNNFTQKAWMGETTLGGRMSEAAQGIDGSSGIFASISFPASNWGGYMHLAGSLERGSTSPEPDFGKSEAGLNLKGATRLTFWAHGAQGGEVVRFFAGGLGDDEPVRHRDSMRQRGTAWLTLEPEWRQYTIDLEFEDLSAVALGFGWVTSEDENPSRDRVEFYLDEIRYEYDAPRGRPLFLPSYAPAAPRTDAAVINGFAYLYDNAVAIMALLRDGYRYEAELLGEAIRYGLYHDRAKAIPHLRNAYASGDPASPPAWLSARGKPFARLPGFWDLDDEKWYEDYFADSTATGNLAWACMALLALADATKDKEYLDAARDIGDLILTFKNRQGSGFMGGLEGFDGDQKRATYLSTEHNIDLVTAFELLAARVEPTEAAPYRDGAREAREFVLRMVDPQTHGLWTGTLPDGVTPNTDVLPLDTNTWAVLALGDALPHPQGTMAFAEKTMKVEDGYDFNQDKDGIWNEGTAQAALAYEAIGETQRADEILAGLHSRALPDGSICAADRDGVSTGFTVSGTDIPWEYGKRVHLGATAWLAFAEQHYNPLAVSDGR